MSTPASAQRPDLPVACTLDADDGTERMRRWQALADLAHPRASRDGGTLEVTFAPAEGAHAELASLAAAEQRCCAFVTWTVTDHDEGPTLRVTAKPSSPDDVAPIAAMFDGSCGHYQTQWVTGPTRGRHQPCARPPPEGGPA